MDIDSHPVRTAAVWTCLFALAATAVPMHASAQAEADKVGDMLRLDTERALAQERLRSAPPAASVSAAARAKPAAPLSVLAIYGVTGRLVADVIVDGVRREFKQGSELSRSASPEGPQTYRLESIDGGCVSVRKVGASRVQRACVLVDLAPPAVTRPLQMSPSQGVGVPFGMAPPMSMPMAPAGGHP